MAAVWQENDTLVAWKTALWGSKSVGELHGIDGGGDRQIGLREGCSPRDLDVDSFSDITFCLGTCPSLVHFDFWLMKRSTCTRLDARDTEHGIGYPLARIGT